MPVNLHSYHTYGSAVGTSFYKKNDCFLKIKKKISHYFEKINHYFEKIKLCTIFKIYLCRNNAILSHYNEMLSCYNKMLSRYNEMLSRYNEKINIISL